MVSSSLAHAWQFHSFIGVNPLQTTWLEHGIVSGRVALLPRSAEIQPLFLRFVTLFWSTSALGWAGVRRRRRQVLAPIGKALGQSC